MELDDLLPMARANKLTGLVALVWKLKMPRVLYMGKGELEDIDSCKGWLVQSYPSAWDEQDSFGLHGGVCGKLLDICVCRTALH